MSPPSFGKIARYGIALAAVAYLIGSGQLRLTDCKLRPDSLPLLVAAAGLLWTGIGVGFIRYWLICRAVNAKLSLPRALRLGVIGTFFNTVLLGGVGGDAVKLIYVSREVGSRSVALASVLVDRVIGLVALLALGGGTLFLQLDSMLADRGLLNLSLATLAVLLAAVWCGITAFVSLSHGRRPALVAWLGLGACYGLAAAWLIGSRSGLDVSVHQRLTWIGLVDAILALVGILVAPSFETGGYLESLIRRAGTLGEKAMNIVRSLLIYRAAGWHLLVCLLISVCSHAFTVSTLYVLGQALALPRAPDLRTVFLAAPPALITNALPVPGGGLGVGEAAFDHLLRLFSKESGTIQGGAAIFLLLRLVMLVTGLVGLPLYLTDPQVSQARQDAAAPAAN